MTEKKKINNGSDASSKSTSLGGSMKEKPSGGFFTTASLFFVSLVLLVHAGFFVILFLNYYRSDIPKSIFWAIYLVFAVYNLIAAMGIVYRRGFGKTLGEILIIFDFVMVMSSLFAPISLILSLPSFIVFYFNRNAFINKDKLSKYVYVVMAVLLLIPVILFNDPSLTPKLFPTSGDVTQEAIEKNDVMICDKISGGERDGCVMEFAKNKKDAKTCGLISWAHNRDLCYLELVKLTHDQSICKLIEGGYERGMCDAGP